jgi:hypothetical protein
MQPLQIIAMTPFELIVRSPTDVFSWVILVPLAFCYILTTIAYRGIPKGAPPFWRAFPIGLAIAITFAFLFFSVWSHTMTLSRQEGMAVLVDRWAGLAYSTQRIPLSKMERATLESARPGTRIAIVLHGGGVVWPFGKAYNPRQNQYAVIDDINEFLGSNAPSPVPLL